MAISELFRQIGQEYLVKASQAKNVEASKLYQSAASLSIRGDIDGAQKIALSAQETLHASSQLLETYNKLMQVFVPGVIHTLKDKFNIDEPPVEFFTGILTQEQPVTATLPTPIPEAPKPQIIVDLDFGELRQKRKTEQPVEKTEMKDSDDLSKVQYKAARVRFRLLDTPKEEASYQDGIDENYQDELKEGVNVLMLKNRIYGNQRSLIKKLDSALSTLTTDISRLHFPLTEAQIARFSDRPDMQEILVRMGKVEAYRGKSLNEIIDYTNTMVRIKLAKTEDQPAVVESGNVLEEHAKQVDQDMEQTATQSQITASEEEKPPYVFNQGEILYLARKILTEESTSLREDDKKYLEEKTDEMILDEKGEDPRVLSESLMAKLKSHKDLGEAFFDAQNETGQFLLALIITKTPEELTRLLS